MAKTPTEETPQGDYTYRAGQRIELEKRPEQLVIRALPGDLSDDVLPGASSSELQQVSSASTRMKGPCSRR